MSWAFRVARVAGIDIKIHATFGLILVLGALQWRDAGAAGAAFGVLLMLFVFFCVVLHELGHSLVAQAFGIPVREIVLLPIGGVAQMTKNPEKPIHELLIAAAGPAVNVVIALVLAAVSAGPLALLDGRGLLPSQKLEPSVPTLVLWVLAANVMLALFNLIPAFPLDGGRMLRAILAMFLGFPRATRVAAGIGQLFAVALGIYGILQGNLLLSLVALFIFLGAGRETAEETARAVLSTRRIGDAYNKHALTLAPGDHVSKVVDYILTSYQPDFAVVQGSELLGVVTRQDVLATLATEADDVYVAGIMKRDVLRVDASESLDEVRRRLAEGDARVAAVYGGDRFLGLVSLEDLAEALLMVTFAERQTARRAAAAG